MKHLIVVLWLFVWGVLGNINYHQSDTSLSLSVFAEAKFSLEAGDYVANVTFSEDETPIDLGTFNVPTCAGDEVWVKITVLGNFTQGNKGAVSMSTKGGHKEAYNVLQFSDAGKYRRTPQNYIPQEQKSIIAYCADGSDNTTGKIQPASSSQSSSTQKDFHPRSTEASPKSEDMYPSSGFNPISFGWGSTMPQSTQSNFVEASTSLAVPTSQPNLKASKNPIQTPNATSQSSPAVTLMASSQSPGTGQSLMYMCVCTAI